VSVGLRVGVDGTSWANRRGYGRFARNAVGRLVELDRDTTNLIYIDDDAAEDASLPDRAVPRRISLRRPPAESAAADSFRPISDLLRLTRAVRRDALDAFLFPSIYTYFPVVGSPTVVGVHDLIADSLPELTLPTRRSRAFWRLKEWAALRQAASIFTVSDASRAALSERLDLEPERIAIVPEAPDAVFYPRGPEAAGRAVAAIGIDPRTRYFLFGGGISPHKNL